VNYIVGSVTPYIRAEGNNYLGKEPSFDVMYVDPDTLLPIDLEVWSFNLEQANEFDTPEWNLKFDYRKLYDLPDMSPHSFYLYSKKILADETSAVKYRNHIYLESPHSINLYSPCDEACRQNYYCSTVVNDFNEFLDCNKYNVFQSLFQGGSLVGFEDLIVYTWYKHIDL
jgi:hypothetical protein